MSQTVITKTMVIERASKTYIFKGMDYDGCHECKASQYCAQKPDYDKCVIWKYCIKNCSKQPYICIEVRDGRY